MITFRGRDDCEWILVTVATLGPILMHASLLFGEDGLEMFVDMCANQGVRLVRAG